MRPSTEPSDRSESPLVAAGALRPFLRQHAPRIEAERRLGNAVFEALYDLGAFSLQVETRYGGVGADLLTSLRVVEELSRGDASSGWCAMVGTESSAIVNALFPAEVVSEILVAPTRSTVAVSVVGAGEAVAVDGGYRASGRFRFASGCRHASWLAGLYTVVEGGAPRTDAVGAPERLLMFAPVSATQLLDTWDTPGLRGTASDDFVLDDVSIPARHATALLAAPLDPAPTYRIPVPLRLASSKAVAMTGIARAALDALYVLLEDRVPFAGAGLAREEARVHLALAEAEARLEAGRALLFQRFEEIWERALRSDEIRTADVAAGRLAVVHAGRGAAEAVDLVQDIAGTHSFLSRPLDRALRDLGVARHHMQLQAHVQEDVGRVLVGLEPRNPLF